MNYWDIGFAVSYLGMAGVVAAGYEIAYKTVKREVDYTSVTLVAVFFLFNQNDNLYSRVWLGQNADFSKSWYMEAVLTDTFTGKCYMAKYEFMSGKTGWWRYLHVTQDVTGASRDYLALLEMK